MAFVKFEGGARRHTKMVTVAAGRIAFWTAAGNLIKGKHSAELYFDKERSLVGIEAFDEEREGLSKIAWNGRNKTYAYISVTAFLKCHEIADERAIPVRIDAETGFLVFKVKRKQSDNSV